MGKLLGLPMGMAPCYTLHSQITLDGQQMATQLLLNGFGRGQLLHGRLPEQRSHAGLFRRVGLNQ
ncbi:MAG: ethanolamine ammonia-lyase subunit EutB [Pirellulales bacterium]